MANVDAKNVKLCRKERDNKERNWDTTFVSVSFVVDENIIWRFLFHVLVYAGKDDCMSFWLDTFY